jgi:hypothetical protein
VTVSRPAAAAGKAYRLENRTRYRYTEFDRTSATLPRKSSLGFRFPRQSPTSQPLVHVYADPNTIETHFHTDLAIVSSAHPFVRSWLELPVVGRERGEWI